MIFQDPMSCLNPYLRILDQVAEPILVHEDVSKEEAESRALEMLKKVGIRDAEKRANSFPHEFSGGMRQRAMIAMALVTKPDVLFADEPTTALDVTVQARILQILRDLRDELGVAVLFITHDLGVVAEVADRVVVMYRGKVVEQGTVRELFKNPSHPYVKGLLACRPSFQTKYHILPTVEDFLETKTALTDLLLRERPDAAQRLAKLESDDDLKGASDSSALLLQVKDLMVHFRSGGGLLGKPREVVKAVDGVSLNIHEGRTGLVGESGCGKTTTGRAILQLIRPTSGNVTYGGVSLSGPCCRENPPVFRKRMQIIFQDPYASLNPRMTIEQALLEPMNFHNIGSGREDRRARVVSLLEEVGLSSSHLRRYPTSFLVVNANGSTLHVPSLLSLSLSSVTSV